MRKKEEPEEQLSRTRTRGRVTDNNKKKEDNNNNTNNKNNKKQEHEEEEKPHASWIDEDKKTSTQHARGRGGVTIMKARRSNEDLSQVPAREDWWLQSVEKTEEPALIVCEWRFEL